MKKPSNHSHRRSAAEWRRLVSLWQRSGESAAVFAEKHRLSKRSLTWWRWKLGAVPPEAANAEADMAFVPLVATPPSVEARWVVETGKGVRVEMSGATALVVDGLAVALSRLREEA